MAVPRARTALGSAAARWIGSGLGLAMGALARVRPASKPMHPVGEVRRARLRRPGRSASGGGGRTGAAFVDGAGDDVVLVRFSRSAGLPAPLPDVNGLAVRVPTRDGGHADLLMSNTGSGRLTRFVLCTSTRSRSGFFGTLLPHRSPSGPVLLAARPQGRRGRSERWELLWARPRGPWTRFAVLEVDPEPGRDAAISFDAVRAAPDGLEVYAWHRSLRDPSYAAARRVRRRGGRCAVDGLSARGGTGRRRARGGRA